ncbi:MAG: hypothetical protein JWM80_136 [Cyanobacteria bacterium RYN_339]|nr:hypothetical protein [Cyanobacteria bacterium RYN_339]
MSTEAEVYVDVIDAMRDGAAARLDPRDLGLPAYAAVLVEALVTALSDDPACRARRPAAFAALWGGRPPTLDNARVAYGGIMAPFTTPDLRWVYKEAGWALGFYDKADEPLMAVLAALQMLAQQELDARMAGLETGPEETVLDTAWRNGFPTSITAADREAARRYEQLALAVVVGLVVCALEFLALTWDASEWHTRRGVVVHLAGARPMLAPLPAMLLASLTGGVAGQAAFGYLKEAWTGFPDLSTIRRIKLPHLLVAILLGPALFLSWLVFGRLKLLIAVLLPIAAAVSRQKLYVPPTSRVAIPPRDTTKS